MTMQIGEYAMESPLMNAGGLVKTIEDVKLMAATGVGAVLAGSFTLGEKVGNSPNGETVYHYDVDGGITTNSLGMPNRGLTTMASEVEEMTRIANDHGKPFVLNIAPIGSDPATEVWQMMQTLEEAGVTHLDGLELNASCPNVVTKDGGRHPILSHNPDRLEEVVDALRQWRTNEMYIGKLIVRISPLEESGTDSTLKLVTALDRGGADAIAAFNTFPNGKPLDARGKPILDVSGGIGGQSGPGMMHAAEAQTADLVRVRDSVAPHLEIIGSNGIMTAEAMKYRLDMGAAAVSATTLFNETRNPNNHSIVLSWGQAVDKILNDFAEAA